MAKGWARAGGLWAWGFVLLCLGLILFAAWAVIQNYTVPRTTITLGSSIVKARLATTDSEQRQGLSGVVRLNDGDGMLFLFTRDGPQPMWMKGMKVPLDILWLDAAQRIVHVEHNVLPESYPKAYKSPKPARYVLEVPAGVAARSGAVIGSVVAFDLP